jgi:hypothetical protein
LSLSRESKLEEYPDFFLRVRGLLVRTFLPRIRGWFLQVFCLGIFLLAPQLHADVGLLLNEPLSDGAGGWTGSGHSAVYFSRICPASPVELRLCQPGEQGSILTNYVNFGEDQPYEWNIVPLNIFLYGVDDARNRPLFASQNLRQKLQEHFWEESLSQVCTGSSCSSSPRAQWRNMVAVPFVRGVYFFVVKTTPEQDLKLIARFNSTPNVSHYNGFRRNCADFARSVINMYFPGAAQPDRINDFGMTSPKAIAKTFSRYAEKHPELEFYVQRFGQVPGDFKQTGEPRKGTEQLFRSKRWLFPMMLRSHELALFTASYWLTGRFNPEHELRRRPTERAAAIEMEMAAARWDKHQALVRQLQEEDQRERTMSFGTADEWKGYAAAVDTLFDLAREDGLIAGRKALRRLFHELDVNGTVVLSEDGAAWLDFPFQGRVRRVGISASNIDAPESDPQFSFLIMLARIDRILHSASKNRELMPQFQADWILLEQTRVRLESTRVPAIVVASAPGPVGSARSEESAPEGKSH